MYANSGLSSKLNENRAWTRQNELVFTTKANSVKSLWLKPTKLAKPLSKDPQQYTIAPEPK